MYKILKKEVLTEDITKFDIYSPVIALKAKAGQFVIIRINNQGERIPLTIADSDPVAGVITIIALRRGKTTCLLLNLEQGDSILDLVGPLGKESEIEKFGRVALIGGGVGIAPIFPIVKALKNRQNHVISIIGAKNKNSLILVEEVKNQSHEFYICTDDGSYCYKGFVSCFLSEYLSNNADKKIDRVIAIGPVPMMKAVCDVTRPYNIKTIVSLNSIMVDGTGMCGTCRVEVGEKTRFACVDGPDFDGHLVNFELLINRQNIYLEEEKKSMQEYLKDHECKILNHIG